MIGRTLWAAFAVFVPLVIATNVAVLAVPHARGIAFVPQLRLAVLVPICAFAALVATSLYAGLGDRPDTGRWALAMTALAVGAWAIILLLGPRPMMAASGVALVIGAAALAMLVPRFVAHPAGMAGGIVLALLGSLEVLGFVTAWRSEQVAPPNPTGLAFDIPRAVFDVDHKLVDLPSAKHVHYVDEGTGPTLLFLHGNPAWSFQWRDLIGGLRSQFRCVALDYPGFGLSAAPPGYGFTPGEQSRVVEELVDRLGLHDVTLVMQDWGGPIGLGFAGRRPELVRAVVLGNTWAWPTSTDEARGKFSIIAGGPLGEFVQMNWNGFASFGLHHGVMHELPADVDAAYLQPFRPLANRGVAAFYPGQITAANPYMNEVDASLVRLHDRPALIFWGMRDQGFPRKDLERFQQAFPTHHTIELPDADHFFFEDARDLMVREIKAFASRGALAEGR